MWSFYAIAQDTLINKSIECQYTKKRWDIQLVHYSR